MKKCEECEKELNILQGYKHPALGKDFLVCGNCFNRIDNDMKRWSKFCLLASNEISNIDLQKSFHKTLRKEPILQKWFYNLWIKLENPESDDEY